MDYIFEEELFEVGAEVDAYCTQCKTDTPHTVLTKYEDEIRSVLCTTCNTSHAYRPPRGETDDEMPEPIAVRRRQLLQKLSWESAMQQLDIRTAVPYSPSHRYMEGQVLEHPTFGLGYVSELLSDTKLEATFKDGTRLLVYNRTDVVILAATRKRARPKAGAEGKNTKKTAGDPKAVKRPTKAARPRASDPAKVPAAKATKPAAAKPRPTAPATPAKAKPAAASAVARPAKPKAKKPALPKAQAKKTAKPAAQKPAKPAAKKTAKPAAKKPAKPQAKKPAKPVAKKPAKPVAKKPAKRKPQAKKPVKPAAKKPAAKKPAKPKTKAKKAKAPAKPARGRANSARSTKKKKPSAKRPPRKASTKAKSKRKSSARS